MKTSPIPPAHDGLWPGRLWSLWELMRRHGNALFSIGALVLSIETGLRYRAPLALATEGQEESDRLFAPIIELMRKSRLFQKSLTEFDTQTSRLKKARSDVQESTEKLRAQEREALDALVPVFEELNLSVSLELLKAIVGENHPNADQMSLVRKAIISELDSKIFVFVSPERAGYYDNEELLPAATGLKFPVCRQELIDAGSCYALGYSTAAVFHAIRSLEAGIRALSRCLGIADPTKAADRNWGRLLKTLKEGIDAKWPTSSNRLSGDGEFFDNAYAALAAMQNPWRNATMHLDQRYTDAEGKHILDAVSDFMNRLANRMDENGDPLA